MFVFTQSKFKLLVSRAEKEEKRKREAEEGKPEKKKRRTTQKRGKNTGATSSTPGEYISEAAFVNSLPVLRSLSIS